MELESTTEERCWDLCLEHQEGSLQKGTKSNALLPAEPTTLETEEARPGKRPGVESRGGRAENAFNAPFGRRKKKTCCMGEWPSSL